MIDSTSPKLSLTLLPFIGTIDEIVVLGEHPIVLGFNQITKVIKNTNYLNFNNYFRFCGIKSLRISLREATK